MFHDKRVALSVFTAVAVAAVAAVPAFAKGKAPHQENSTNAPGHVTICHATPADTAAHGHVRISPSASGGYHGHPRQHDADIIPPFVSGVTHSENWDATGQTIWNNDCVVPAATTGTSNRFATAPSRSRTTPTAWSSRSGSTRSGSTTAAGCSSR
jgi:hypothetical protein